MTTLKDFLGNGDEKISDAAALLIEIKEDFDKGNITKEERDDLITSLLDMDNIDDLADNIDRQNAIREAFEAMKAIMSLI